MKIRIIPCLVLLTATLFCSCDRATKKSMAQEADQVVLQTSVDTLSWVLGEQLGRQFAMVQQANELPLKRQLVEEAFCTAYEGMKSPLDERVSETIYQLFTASAIQRQQEQKQSQASSSEQQEAAYFAKLTEENPNVKYDASGVYYEVVRAGAGAKARLGDRVRFDYKGFNMLSGELFDQTYGNREPITHVVSQPMFEGLLRGIQLMNAGSIYRLYIPSGMAFGAQGTKDIPPYTPVIYEIELHEIFDK